MTPELAAAIYDRLVPGWRSARRSGNERRIGAPYRDDQHASLDIHEGKLTWIDRTTQEGGGAWDLAVRTLGEFVARELVREIERRLGGAPRPQGATPPGAKERTFDVEVLGAPTAAQVEALQRDRRFRDAASLPRICAKHVRARFWSRERETWGLWAEWLGIPALGGSWKLWGIDGKGRVRTDAQGKLARLNAGSVSLILSPDLARRNGGSVTRLYDLEGESDLLAAVDAGMLGIISSTGGAGSLNGHDTHRERLLVLHPEEVVVFGDLDDAGRAGAEKRARWWLEQGVPVRLPELPAELGQGGDVRDFLVGWPAQDGRPALEWLGGAADLDALADASERREPSAEVSERKDTEDGDRPAGIIVPLTSVESRRVSWLWPGRIPLGKVTVLDGDPGLGKSTITLDFAARVSTGRPMADDAPNASGGAGVVLLSAEDDLADTIRPRLETAGANLERVVALTGVRGESGERLPAIPEDLARVEEAIRDVDARVVIVDPLMAFLGGEVNAHRDQDVRRALAPLARVAERTGVAVVVVRHLNKSGAGGNPLYRGGGSIGIIGAARSGLLVARDPDDEGRCVLAVTKANLGPVPPALAYRIVEAENGAAAVEWLGTSGHNASTLLAVPATEEERGAVEEAEAVLREILAAGSLPVREVRRQAKAAGVADRTLDRAKAKIGVCSGKADFSGPWAWCLPCNACARWPKYARNLRSTPSPGVGALGGSWRSSRDSGAEVEAEVQLGRRGPDGRDDGAA